MLAVRAMFLLRRQETGLAGRFPLVRTDRYRAFTLARILVAIVGHPAQQSESGKCQSQPFEAPEKKSKQNPT
jgi:hypothetical protein